MDCDFRMRDVKMFTHFIYMLSAFSIELFELTLFFSFFSSSENDVQGNGELVLVS